MTSNTLPGWQPSQPNAFARPVQDEDATWGPLCGAELPDGTGCLVWANGSNVRFAHTPGGPESWLVDDSVPSSAMATAVATGDSIRGTTVFVADGELYLMVHIATANKIDLYKADNPNLPTAWTYRSTAWTHGASGPFFGNANGVGHPTILESGRWVLATKSVDGAPDVFQAVSMRAFYSDNEGLSWTHTYTYAHAYPGFPRTEFAGAHIARDPSTGKLWFMSGTTISGPDNQIALHQSSNDGTSWSCAFTGGYPYTNPRPIPFLDNGSEMWAFDSTYQLFRGIAPGSNGFPDNANWPSSGIPWIAPGATYYEEHQQRGIVTSGAAYFFLGDQVMKAVGAAGGWVHHAGPMGAAVTSGFQ